MPARNIIVYIKTDPLYLLTILLNERQQIEEKEKKKVNDNYTERPVKSVILKEYGNPPEKTITFYPDIRKVKAGAVFDLYVKFTDIYQRLDKLHLHSQEPGLYIEEAGEFTTDHSPPQSLPDEIINPSDTNLTLDIEGTAKEYYQHIRLKMPTNSVTLDLKWEERLFCINYNIRAAEFFELTQIKDTTKKEDITIGPFNGNTADKETQQIVRQSNFPYYTYPVIETYRNNGNTLKYPPPPDNKNNKNPKPHIIRNAVTIISSLKSNEIVKEGTSYYKIGERDKIKFGNNSNNSENDLIISENLSIMPDIYHRLHYHFKIPKIMFNFYMPKDNVEIAVDAGMRVGDNYIINYKNYERSSITVNPGYYHIYIRGGQGGGRVGTSGGHVSGEFSGDFVFQEITTLTIMPGQAGTDGMRGSQSDGGTAQDGQSGEGGGGGSSIITFSSMPVGFGYDAIYCIGGDGRGADKDHGVGGGWSGTHYTHNGSREYYETEDGNGRNGWAGGQGGGGIFTGSGGGAGGGNGIGGLGWALSNVDNFIPYIVEPVRVTDNGNDYFAMWSYNSNFREDGESAKGGLVSIWCEYEL
jgi:hypothetical protein